MFYIYCLKDLNSEIQYVGQTKNPTVRKRDHIRNKPPHTFEIIEQFILSEEAKYSEINYIKKYNTYTKGWNKSPGGEGFDNYNRKGIGGVKKGSVPWNKGIKNCFSIETIENMKLTRSGRVFSRKINDNQIKEIRKLYEDHPNLLNVGLTMKNGRKMSYIQAFCKEYCSMYGLTPQGIKSIILKECWKNV
jgi:hypothetical protein